MSKNKHPTIDQIKSHLTDHHGWAQNPSGALDRFEPVTRRIIFTKNQMTLQKIMKLDHGDFWVNIKTVLLSRYIEDQGIFSALDNVSQQLEL